MQQETGKSAHLTAHLQRKARILRAPMFCVGCLFVIAALLADSLLDTWHGLGVRHSCLLVTGIAMLLVSVRASLAFAARLNLALFAAAFVIFSVDIAVRLTYPIPPVGAGDWAGTPHTAVQLISAPDKFQATRRYNALGFRGAEVSLKRTTERRIICIGDSWTEGIGATEVGS